ncbi:hypothetical protein [Microtetraspora malaysiensis]|uniref:Tail assembly chaperone n=1 Tax=Microtetraspora malaysiensis TaxID=161358 RepID=A0ABW6SNP9_9ACTN
MTVSDEELAGVVVADDLVFTTTAKDSEPGDLDERRIPFKVDGEVYYAVRPRKLAEVMTMMSRAAARRASVADQVFAVMEFLDKVITPESASRLMDRYDDDADDFGVEELMAIMERLVAKLTDEVKGQQPARPRARGGRAVARR